MKRFEINFTDEQFEKLSEGAELRLFVDGDETIITLVEPDPEPETDSGDDEKATEIDIEKFTEVINEAVRDIVTSISLETTGTLPKEA